MIRKQTDSHERLIFCVNKIKEPSETKDARTSGEG